MQDLETAADVTQVEDASARWLAVEPTPNVFDRVLIESGVKAARNVADVWRGQQVR